jgi:DNA-binding transcriptional MerR regulator
MPLHLATLPPPLKMSLGMAGGVFNRYPAWAVDRARFVAEKRAAGFTYDEIRAMLAAQGAREAPDAPAAVKPKAADTKRPKAAASKGRGRR